MSTPPAQKPKTGQGKHVRVVQTRSAIGYAPDQHATLRGLGLGKPNAEKVLLDTPSLRGMINKVRHIVRVEDA